MSMPSTRESPTEKLENPRDKIGEAIAIMVECRDYSYRAAMEELRDLLPTD